MSPAVVPQSNNPHGDRLRAAREVVGLRSVKALAEFLDTRGFSTGKLQRIESSGATLAPQDAEYIARRLGLPRSFFTAPIERLGDIARGDEDALSQRAEAQHALADEALAALDAARRGAPDQSTPEGQQSQRKRTA